MRISRITLCEILILFLFVSVSCSKEIDEIKSDVLRANVKLTNTNIPILINSIEIRDGETPLLWEAGWDNNERFYVVKYDYSWKFSNDDFINVNLTVAESNELAKRYLIGRLELCTFPLTPSERMDNPAIVGDISYDNGLNFIRDNIIIEIHNESSVTNFQKTIIEQIDSKILDSPSFNSLVEIKPIIREFSISKNPVVEMTKTPLIIHIEDPNNLEVVYKWRYDKSSGYGGIHRDDSDNYYYKSSWADTSISEIGLTLIAINEYGFYSDSTIFIKTIKE